VKELAAEWRGGNEINFHGLEKHFQKMDNADTGLGGQPSINSRSFMGRTESPYDLLFTQK
jgi:hypothetical protein